MSTATDAVWAVGGGVWLVGPAVGIVAVVVAPDGALRVLGTAGMLGVVVGLVAVAAGVVPGLRRRVSGWVERASAVEVAVVEGVWEGVAFAVVMGTVAPVVTGQPPSASAFAGESAVVVAGVGVVVFTGTSLLKQRLGGGASPDVD